MGGWVEEGWWDQGTMKASGVQCTGSSQHWQMLPGTLEHSLHLHLHQGREQGAGVQGCRPKRTWNHSTLEIHGKLLL